VKWVKRGRLFEPAGAAPWMASHAALPVVEERAGKHRVYCSGRDASGRAHIGHFELDLEDHAGTPRVCPEPVLDPGPLGTFDDRGVTSSCLVEAGGQTYLYYTGWSLGVTVPFYLFVGLAVREGGDGPFRKVSAAPILDRSGADPYLTASPWVLVEDGRWRMWYVSGSGWEQQGERVQHRYHIRYAESPDGRRWDRRGVVCVDYASAEEYAFARPCVVKDGGRYRMWYAVRGARYRIGYAESADGLAWERMDAAAGIDVSESGWDSEMVEYPCVFDHRGARYLLYNGNDYGRTGVGLAVQAPER
jgi:hypothetical protein